MSKTHYTLPTVALPEGEPLNLYIAGGDLGNEERKALISYLLSTLRSGNHPNKPVLEMALAIFSLAIPGLGPELAGMDSFVITARTVTLANFTGFISHDPTSSGDLTSLPILDPPIVGALLVDSVEGVYAGVSSLLIAIGKQGGSGPEASAVKARPSALINRFGIPEAQQLVLPGKDAGPTLEGLDRIYTAFSTYTEPRSVIVKYCLAVNQQQGHLPLDLEILMTNFRLMRGAGMTHVDAITKLMHMHPWTVRVPELGPYYEKFAIELEQFRLIPANVRAYHRLLVPQGEFLFLTPDYRPLIAVAGAYIEEVESTFANYVYGKGDYAQLIQTVRSYQPGTAAYIGAGTLASKLGVQDMSLPTRGPLQTATPRAMV